MESRRVAEERIARGIMGAGHSGPVAGRASIATGTMQGTTAAPRRRAAALAPREAGSGGGVRVRQILSGDRHRVCDASWGCPPSVRELLPTDPNVAQGAWSAL